MLVLENMKKGTQMKFDFSSFKINEDDSEFGITTVLGYKYYAYGKIPNRVWYTGIGYVLYIVICNRLFVFDIILEKPDKSKRPVHKNNLKRRAE